MMVVWYHSVGQVDGTLTFIRYYHWGTHGVDLFFVISGFIMLVTTWDKPIGPVEFMRHRMRRIVPLYWLATLVMVGLATVAPALFKSLKWDVPALLKSLFFIPYDNLSVPGTTSPLLIPGWTLNYEMFFYALFALSLLASRAWRLPLVIGALSILVAAGLVFHPTNIQADFYTNPMMLEFCAGMILGRLWVMKKRVQSKRSIPLLLGLGDASYSIYLTHIFTLGALRVVWVKLITHATFVSSIALMGVSLTVCALAGWLCHRFIELRMTSWLRSKPGLPLVTVVAGQRR